MNKVRSILQMLFKTILKAIIDLYSAHQDLLVHSTIRL